MTLRITPPALTASGILMIESATGIVKTIVGPIIVPSISPEKFPIESLAASFIASGYPPMSQASSVVANIEASEPTMP